MRKAILLKTGENYQVVELSDNADYQEIKDLLEIENPIDCVTRVVQGKSYDMWVDDEGLLTSGDLLANGVCMDAEEYLIGNILITKGVDEDGEIVGLDEEDIKNITNPNILIDVNDFMRFRGYPDNTEFLEIYGRLKLKRNGKLLPYSIS